MFISCHFFSPITIKHNLNLYFQSEKNRTRLLWNLTDEAFTKQKERPDLSTATPKWFDAKTVDAPQSLNKDKLDPVAQVQMV